MSTTSFYAGSGRGRLEVTTWDELVAAVQAGSMTETQWVECKVAVPASTARANLELAKDLASLTVDGGVLVIGVEDKATSAGQVVGMTDPVDGLKERLSQIASGTRVQPAMHVVLGDPLPNPAEPGRHALLVSVPASASAPHMVDGHHWGRSATGKRALTDTEVAQLFEQRRLRVDDFEAKLRRISDELDPVPAASRTAVHFSVLVRPEMRPREDFVDQIADQHQLTEALVGARQGTNYRANRSPNFLELGRSYAHADGPSREATVNPPSNPHDPVRVAVSETQHMRLLVGEDGAVSVAAARGSYPHPNGGTRIDFVCIVEIVHQAMKLAGFLGQDVMAYAGMWQVGVHVTGMEGHLGHTYSGFSSDMGQPFVISEYLRTATVSTVALVENPVPAIDRLLRGLARASGFLGDLSSLMDPETTPLM